MTCHFYGCTEPHVPGRGHRYCPAHSEQRRATQAALKREEKRTPCMHQDCTEPKRPGRGERFCDPHAALRALRTKRRELAAQRARRAAIVRELAALLHEADSIRVSA